MIKTLAFGNYRSLRDLRLSVDRLTVITGGNGAGKSNVYRALKLLVDAAEGQLGRALAREGGLPSARRKGRGSAWASPTTTSPTSSGWAFRRRTRRGLRLRSGSIPR